MDTQEFHSSCIKQKVKAKCNNPSDKQQSFYKDLECASAEDNF